MNKEEIINKLRPIERVFLISKEKEEIYTKKNKLYALVYFLIDNKNLSAKDNDKYTINFKGTIYNNEYELKFLDLLNSRNFIELDKFIDKSLVFNQTLIDIGVISKKVESKKGWLFTTAKETLGKTSQYYEIQAHYSELFGKGLADIDVVCGEKHIGSAKLICLAIKNNLMRQIEENKQKDTKEKEKKDKEDKKKGDDKPSLSIDKTLNG